VTEAIGGNHGFAPAAANMRRAPSAA